jgi:hypothetical protein
LGFSFALAGQGQLLILPLKLLLFPRGMKHESGGPTLFKPSLKVEGDIAHIKPPGNLGPIPAPISIGISSRSQ